jgi:UDP-N-acetylmuramoylalanine--D-glutamate ligase
MRTVVNAAAGMAVPGDVVLLAPAAASLDMYSSYAARGDGFAAAALALPGASDPTTAAGDAR